jgi:hypothetical protein
VGGGGIITGLASAKCGAEVGGGGIITGLASAKWGADVGGGGIITGLAKADVVPAIRTMAERGKMKRKTFEVMV